MSAKGKLAKLAERLILGSDPSEEAAADLRKQQEEDAKKQEGKQ